MSDVARPEKCEICGEGPVERVLYPVAVHFKGSGFYSTDYGRGGAQEGPTSNGRRDGGDSDVGAEESAEQEARDEGRGDARALSLSAPERRPVS